MKGEMASPVRVWKNFMHDLSSYSVPVSEQTREVIDLYVWQHVKLVQTLQVVGLGA